MSKNSLHYSNVQSKDSSWIDDPFHLEQTSFKGMKHMSHAKRLTNYAEELVSDYGKHYNDHVVLNLDMVPQCEQDELARLYIESIDRDIESACYGEDESINSEYISALLNMLKDDTKQTREYFAKVTRKNILSYYKKSLNEVLLEACQYLEHLEMEDSGYSSRIDMDHGDVVWGKF